VAVDPDVGTAKGYGFVSFENFEASDAAIEAMNGQFLMNKIITVTYAFKKDGKGERHGSAAGTKKNKYQFTFESLMRVDFM
jgi:splicing factor 3B subunit 4